jgi:hypothetical protein
MSYPNYLNGIPSSLVGYGNQRLQFQSYDGVLSTASRVDDANLDTLEKQVTALDTKISSLINTLAGFGISPGQSGSLTVNDLTAIDVKATTTSVGTNTVKNFNINTDGGTGIVMNDRGILFRGSGDSTHRIIYNGETGVDGIDIRGNKGGALGFMDSGVRKACMDWGSERIRSPKTFQAGYVSADNNSGTISFQTEFETPPCVFATVYGENGNYLFFITIYDIQTDSFKYKKRYLDGANMYNSTTEDWGWVAFDPTNTSIF